MIDDKELRELFKAESEEHLEQLNSGLLRLENNQGDAALLEELFREAHSLKGSARMLGISDIETVAHRVEDILGLAHKGKSELTANTIDLIYYGLDVIKKLVHEAVTGESTNLSVLDTLAVLNGEKSVDEVPAFKEKRSDSAESAIESEVETPDEIEQESFQINERHSPQSVMGATVEEDYEKEEISSKSDSEAAPVARESHKIDTVRVDPKKLDNLMTRVGELIVTKTRIKLRQKEIEDMMPFMEEWLKEISALPLLIKRNNGKREIEGVNQLLDYYHTERDRVEQFGKFIKTLANSLNEDNARLDFIANELDEGIRNVRLLPMSAIFKMYPRMVRDISKEQGKNITFDYEGGDTTADKRIIEEMKDPLMHLIRNAIDHGIESLEERESMGKSKEGSVLIKAFKTPTNIVIEVSDDGKGLERENIKRIAIKKRIIREDDLSVMTDSHIDSLIFSPGFSTSTIITDVSGRGIGLDVVRTNVERLKGNITVESGEGKGCRFIIKLPITLATTLVFIVVVKNRKFAIPVEYVKTTRRISKSRIFSMEGRGTYILDDQPVSVAWLSDLLELKGFEESYEKEDEKDHDLLPCIILKAGDEELGIIIDELVDEQEIVLKPHSAVLKRVRNVSGSTILGSGDISIVLNIPDLFKSVRKHEIPLAPVKEIEVTAKKQVILLAEDSITTRTQEKRILESAGYEVVTAVDGVDAFGKLSSGHFDALVSDIQMPNMDGLSLTEKIRKETKYKDIPIILVTALSSEEDKRRGVEVGADAYITKPSFDQKSFVSTIKRLV